MTDVKTLMMVRADKALAAEIRYRMAQRMRVMVTATSSGRDALTWLVQGERSE